MDNKFATKDDRYLVQVIVNGEVKVSKTINGLAQAKAEKGRLTKYNRRNLVIDSEEYRDQQNNLYGSREGRHTVISINLQKLNHQVEGNELNTIVFDLVSKLEVTHNLGITPANFKAVKEGEKLFEIRKNDRQYHVGDILLLNEYACGSYTGEFVKAKVTYITDYAQKDDYVVLGIKLCEK